MQTTRETKKLDILEYQEAAKVLAILRALGSEEQRIAFAFMEGMKTQKAIDSQSPNKAQVAD